MVSSAGRVALLCIALVQLIAANLALRLGSVVLGNKGLHPGEDLRGQRYDIDPFDAVEQPGRLVVTEGDQVR
jgi:hypothetical protein